MKFTRKDFLKTAAGFAALAAIPGKSAFAAESVVERNVPKPVSNGKPKRGVSLYSYKNELYTSMTLEDCFADMSSMGAYGLEILANGHVKDYPNPTDEWVEEWFRLLNKYGIIPVEYGHWVDSRRHEGRELTTKESYDSLVTDIKLAHKLGFTVMRTKLGVIDETLNPVKNWKEFIEMALPVAKEHNVVMCPEIHQPTALKSKMVDEYVEFIEKNNTKNFGLNIDFGVFQSKEHMMHIPGIEMEPSKPEDLVPLLPYIYCCHAKFANMTDDLIEETHPYKEIIKVLIDNKYDGYMLSEYEGEDHNEIPGYVPDQLRRQHLMMKRYLGEV